VAASPAEDVPSALDDPKTTASLSPWSIRTSCCRGTGIPAIDEPTFLSPERVDFLEEAEPVMALEIGNDAGAYPLQIMTWHEIVNDTVDGVPVAVTYCPLCNTAVS
jgi:hypothetical protein